MDLLPPLKKWVIKNKFYLKSGTKNTNPTHYLLDGGIWKIPLTEYSEFLRLLSNDLINNEKYYISENKTEIFRFICDLDFYDSSETNIEYLNNILKIINEVISEYYPPQKIIVCGTDPKIINDSGNITIKTGFHLVFPKLWVNKNTAKALRDLIVSSIHVERISPQNSWEDVVDSCIYDQNGLRMVGCRKIIKCKNCKKEECEKCKNTGKIDEGRVYKPLFCINSDDEYINTLKNDYYILLLETCIINYLSLPETSKIKELIIQKKEGIQKNISKENDINDDYKKISAFIKKNFSKEYSFEIKKITKLNDNLIVIEPVVNYCANVNRCHSSSNTYFQIKKSGICQRCFCTKKNNNNISCKEYSSKEIPLTTTLKNLFFKENNNKNQKKISNINISINNNKINTIRNCKNFLKQLEFELLNESNK
jgi:hypothetical protein